MNFLLSTIEGMFYTAPLAVAGALLHAVGFWENRNRRFVLFGVSALLSLLAVVFVRFFLPQLFGEITTFRQLLSALILAYGVYLIVVLPLFLLFSYFKQGRLERGLRTDKKITSAPKKMELARQKAGADAVFLGRSMKTKRNILLSSEMRKMHAHVVGSTGAGKTDSLILPLLVQDIERGRGALVMDAKGDRETFNKIAAHVRRIGREKDFLFFSLAYPERSNTYNPLLRGNPTELKAKIISANVWTEEFYKKKSEETLLLLMKSLREAGEIVTFHKLYRLLSNEHELSRLEKSLKNVHLKESMKHTIQIEEDITGKNPTGMGTLREVEEFRVKPNVIRELGRGEAAIIIKQPFITDVIQLDYIGHYPRHVA